LMALVTVGSTIIPSIAGLMMANIQLQEAKVAFNRLFEISSLEKEYESAEDVPGRVSAKPAKGKSELLLQNLSFRFHGRSPTLKDVNLQVKTGEIIAVFGPVGSGKSTLVDLIQRFYLPETGIITINGKDLAGYGLPTWRSMIAAVAQTEKIFNSTIL